ncbi:MAG TPA: cohesin domain-containing protein [Bryobacteraceae bacterium]|nr:cohesin domain-containing protein [Bryobacteraceae bacterium]
MLTFHRLAKGAGCAWLAMTLASTLAARTRKGDKLLVQSHAAEVRKDWDKAISLAEQALSEDPAEISYQLVASRLRFYAGQFHIEQGLRLREQGKLAEALVEFQKGYGINPASTMAPEEIERTRRMIEREQQKPAAERKPEEAALTPTEVAKQKEQKKFEAMQSLPELKPLNPEPIYLKMNNQPPKVLFETVGKYAGINVLFDPDYTTSGGTKPQSIELNNSTLNEALDDLALITKSFWKPLSANTIFVTQDNPTSRRNFEDWVTKVFYLNNVLTTQELQEIMGTVRSVAELAKAFQYGAQNAIVVRGEADKVALAEKIIADLDKPRSEVLVDVLVMTVNRNRERDLAAAIAPNGINSAISFTPRSSIAVPNNSSSTTGVNGTTTPTASTSTTIPLSEIARISTRDFSLTLPGGLLNALMTDASTKVLQRPQVRAVDRQKVSMKIGDKVPYATGSFQPGIGGVGINPLVNTQFQFLETGVNLDITPYVHNANEVSLHVEVDISNVTGEVPLGGINEPELAQTKIINDVRLKQGEINLMGGLMQVEEDKSVSGVPGLGNIPILRRLFTSETTTTKQSELVIVLIPHIIRSVDITDVNLKTIDSGNSTSVHLRYAPQKPETPPAPQPQATAPPAPQPAPAAAADVTVPPQTPPAAGVPNVVVPAQGAPVAPVGVPRIPGVNAPPAGAPPMGLPVQPAKPQPTQEAAGKASVKFVPAQTTAQVNGTVTVSLMVDNAADLASTPMLIRFDPKILQLGDVVRGNLLASDGQQVAFSKNVLNDTGEATVNVSRFPTTGGVSGSGTIVTLVFRAIAPGDTVVTVPSLVLRNSQSQPILTATPALTVSVK